MADLVTGLGNRAVMADVIGGERDVLGSSALSRAERLVAVVVEGTADRGGVMTAGAGTGANFGDGGSGVYHADFSIRCFQILLKKVEISASVAVDGSK